MNDLMLKFYFGLDNLINRLSNLQVILSMIAGLILLPAWVTLLKIDNTNSLGWGLMAAQVIPTFSFMYFYRWKR